MVADHMLQKVTAGLPAGNYPDVAYIFGSDLANLARSDKVVDLTDAVKEPGSTGTSSSQPLRRPRPSTAGSARSRR